MRRVLVPALLAGALCAGPARGADFRPLTSQPDSVPAGISYQGRLQQNGVVLTSNPRAPWGIVFKLYDSKEGGNLIERLPPLTTMSYSIDIVSGMFNVNIPVTTNTLVGGGQRWLEVEILQPHQDPGSGQTMKPRGQLFSMPYALVAKAIEGTIDISTGGLVVTTGPVSGNAAFYISSTTAFNGIWTAHPYSLLTMSSGTLTLDGAGASLHLSSGPMAIDGAGADLDVLGPARFGGAGAQSSFDGAGTLQLASPLAPLSGGTGQDFHLAARGDIPYFSVAGVRMSPLGIGAAGKILQSNGTAPVWTSAAYPGSVTKGKLLYGSLPDVVSLLGIGAASTTLRSDGTVPVWDSITYPGSVARGDLLYGWAVSSVSLLGIGAVDRILQSDGTFPAWSNVTFPGSVALGDLLYGSAVNTVSRLPWAGAATRYLANTGASSSPAWDQVDLVTGIKNTILPVANGGTGANLGTPLPPEQGSIPFFKANVMTTLGPTAAGALAGWVLMSNGANTDPSWLNLEAGGGPPAWATANLQDGQWGAVPFQHGAGATAMLVPVANGRILMSRGPGVDVTWTTAQYPPSTTSNQLLYSNADNTLTGLTSQINGILVTGGTGTGIPSIGTDIPTGVTIGSGYIYRANGTQVALADGGTSTDLSVATLGSLIYRAPGNLAGSGPLTGVLRADSAGPTAMTGTLGYNAYWVTASTIAAERYLHVSRGGTGADLSLPGVTVGSVIYKKDATTLGGTGVLPLGILKGNGAAVPTAMTGTLGYNAYWSDANTIAAERYLHVSRGGTGANLSLGGVAVGSVIYKKDATTLGGTGVLPLGVLKGNGAAVPTAMTGTAGYNAYWSDANTISAELYLNVSRGGTGADLSLGGVAVGSVIYKKDATTLGGTGVLPLGVLKGNGAAVPTAMTGTAGYNAYWSDANTIAGAPSIAAANGGTGTDLSGGADIGGLIYKFDATTLANTGVLPPGVLKGNGAALPTAMTGTAGYNAYWSDANTIAGAQIIAAANGGTGTDLSGAADIGGLIYKFDATTLANTGALTGVLKGNGAGLPTALTGTAGYNAYWSDANTIAGVQYIATSIGGTGANLPSAAPGGLIYKLDANTLDGTGALTGVLKGNGAGLPTALTGTAGYNAYWSDANTIAGVQYITIAIGGTGADLPSSAPGGLVYKLDANTLDGTGALTGVLKGNGAGAPTALTGTSNYNAYWFDANTVKAEQYTDMTRGGTGADLSGVPTIGGLIYKFDATTLARTAPLTGVLQGTGAGAPTALTGTAGYNAYWFDANTVKAEQYTDITRGGTGSSLPLSGTGGLIYKRDASTLDGTAALSGVLKGNGAGAPTLATVDDLVLSGPWQYYLQTNVAITGGTIGTATVLTLYNRNISQLQGTPHDAIGQMFFCTDCSPAKIVVSTGAAAGEFADITGGDFK